MLCNDCFSWWTFIFNQNGKKNTILKDLTSELVSSPNITKADQEFLDNANLVTDGIVMVANDPNLWLRTDVFNQVKNTEVYSIANGTVVEIDKDERYGNYIVVNTSDNYHVIYTYLDKVNVKANDELTNRMIIATSGSSGKATGDMTGIIIINPNSEFIDYSPVIN